jgi:hypothetical protein
MEMPVQGLLSYAFFSGHNSGDYGVVETRTVMIPVGDVFAQASLIACNGAGAHRAGIAGFTNVALGGGQTFPDWKSWPATYFIQSCTSVTFGYVSPGHGSTGVLCNVWQF